MSVFVLSYKLVIILLMQLLGAYFFIGPGHSQDFTLGGTEAEHRRSQDFLCRAALFPQKS